MSARRVARLLGSPLTARETEVLHLGALGATNRQIGRQVYLSEDAVKSHWCRICQRLGARSRAHAVALALAPGGWRVARDAATARPGRDVLLQPLPVAPAEQLVRDAAVLR